MSTIITLRGAARRHGTGEAATTALHPTDLSVRAGEHVAVTGPSGSGKSTLLNLVAGIDRPTAGSVVVAGTGLGDLAEGALAAFRGAQVGIVFQSFELVPTLTALENILLAMDLVGKLPGRQRRPRALDLLRQVGLADKAGRLPSRLSGGEQQRVAVARALANDPPLLVADEPTGNLDRDNGARVLDLFARCAAEGRTVVVATHQQAGLERFSRRLHLEDGRVVADGAPTAPAPTRGALA